jgi:hypothetical protein
VRVLKEIGVVLYGVMQVLAEIVGGIRVPVSVVDTEEISLIIELVDSGLGKD